MSAEDSTAGEEASVLVDQVGGGEGKVKMK